MLWAIIWDIVWSIYEWNNTSKEDFPLFSNACDFTDDTVLTLAVADALMNKKDLVKTLQEYTLQYPWRWYGTSFMMRVSDWDTEPYNSFGNGSGMRVSSVGWMFDTLEEVLDQAKKTAEVTHNHPEGSKWAQAIASAIFLARTGKTKAEIKWYIEETFEYDLSWDYYEAKKIYDYDVTCQGSVPQSIVCFLISSDFEDAIRKAVAFGWDTDTIACMTWSIAEAFYKEISDAIIDKAREYLDKGLNDIVDQFREKYVLPKI